jgi:hypothetical protein
MLRFINSKYIPMISTANITMQFGEKPLFENISIKFSPHEFILSLLLKHLVNNASETGS